MILSWLEERKLIPGQQFVLHAFRRSTHSCCLVCVEENKKCLTFDLNFFCHNLKILKQLLNNENSFFFRTMLSYNTKHNIQNCAKPVFLNTFILLFENDLYFHIKIILHVVLLLCRTVITLHRRSVYFVSVNFVSHNNE
jgi:hypothetical protein